MKLALFEDDQFLIDVMTGLLKKNGHDVVLTCMSLADSRIALTVDSHGKLKSAIDFDAAIVDGNLSPGISGQDGVQICRLLRTINPSPVIIGNSGGGTVVGADHQARKDLSFLLALLPTLGKAPDCN